jgi:flagellar M-ring protein FliF
VRHVIQPAGRLKRIAAAVLVDDAVEMVEKSGAKTPSRRKRTGDEMKEIERLASAAIGLDTQRGDMLAVQNLSFQEPPPPESPEAPGAVESARRLLVEWSALLRYAAVGLLFAIVYFLILGPVKRQVLAAFRQLPARAPARPLTQTGAEGIAAAPAEIELPAGSEGARRATALKKQLSEKVKTEPAAAGRLVQTWIRESSAQ